MGGLRQYSRLLLYEANDVRFADRPGYDVASIENYKPKTSGIYTIVSSNENFKVV